ncbi:MAG: NRDE family protein [Pseudomonadota bacterium]
MCTLTIHINVGRTLVTMNRDEQRSRPVEHAPYLWEKHNILAPQDTKAGGTWIAMNDASLIACLLNGYRADDTDKAFKTRGEIIPYILSQPEPSKAMRNLDYKGYGSFHLILIDHNIVKTYSWDGKDIKISEWPNQEWYFFTSSSFKQTEVQQIRRDRFKTWLEEGALFQGFLPTIHCQREDEKPAHSVLMSRDDACTKSITQFEITAKEKVYRYWPTPHENVDKYNQSQF